MAKVDDATTADVTGLECESHSYFVASMAPHWLFSAYPPCLRLVCDSHFRMANSAQLVMAGHLDHRQTNHAESLYFQQRKFTDDTTGFKIYEDGLDSNGTWGVDRLIANAGNVSLTIPSCIASGQYD